MTSPIAATLAAQRVELLQRTEELGRPVDVASLGVLHRQGQLQLDPPGVVSPNRACRLFRTADDWMENGKKVDGTTVDALLREIRLLAAMKFVTSGFSSAATTLTVTSNGGKRVEKVLVSKAGDHLVAKREGESLLYQLDAKGLDDLQKAADAVQAADAPKK